MDIDIDPSVEAFLQDVLHSASVDDIIKEEEQEEVEEEPEEIEEEKVIEEEETEEIIVEEPKVKLPTKIEVYHLFIVF